MDNTYSFFKRFFDIGISAGGIVLLFPFLALIAAAIRLESKGPAFYRGLRPGQLHTVEEKYVWKDVKSHKLIA